MNIINIKNFLATSWVECLLFLVLIVILLVFFKLFCRGKKGDNLYNPRMFLTKNEKDCFIHLKKNFPEYHICPQVSMGAVLEPNITNKSEVKSHKDKSNYTVLRNKIQSKVIDFVLMNQNLEVEFIIELDDKSHDTKKELDALRDKNLLGAGIKTVRFRRENGKFPTRAKILSDLKD